jgi:hypothetical protein
MNQEQVVLPCPVLIMVVTLKNQSTAITAEIGFSVVSSVGQLTYVLQVFLFFVVDGLLGFFLSGSFYYSYRK